MKQWFNDNIIIISIFGLCLLPIFLAILGVIIDKIEDWFSKEDNNDNKKE